ncbi:hypothetical protein C8F04DRAFT_1197041 [Mycena alexandri]|uniref:Uncharacterized protein n=1 Tax=Mycena alexandri TaxID=1745969 RepID=A0AAD6WMQ2_9AGAR|nr:hypothetical protein C8F04DRAFT_1197041 [Mycena alexandri]
MSLISFTTRYRLIYTLSLLQVVIGVSMIYGAEGGIGHIYPPLGCSSSFSLLSGQCDTPAPSYILRSIYGRDNASDVRIRLSGLPPTNNHSSAKRLPYTLKVDPTNRFSRVDTHHTSLIVVIIFCGGCLMAINNSFQVSKAFTSCASTPLSFMELECIPLGMHVALPLGILVTVCPAYRALRRRATTLYGSELVPAPQFGSSAPTEARFIPAWKAAHVADVVREADVEEAALKLLDPK